MLDNYKLVYKYTLFTLNYGKKKLDKSTYKFWSKFKTAEKFE